MLRPPKPAKTPELAAAEAAVLEHLASRRFADAARVVAAYEAQQPVPRVLGVDWKKHAIAGDVLALTSIFDSPDDESMPVRTAAAMMYLWGVSKPYRRWLAKEANGDRDATKLVLSAYAARQAAAYASARERGFIP